MERTGEDHCNETESYQLLSLASTHRAASVQSHHASVSDVLHLSALDSDKESKPQYSSLTANYKLICKIRNGYPSPYVGTSS
jgi:hypothetical protein